MTSGQKKCIDGGPEYIYSKKACLQKAKELRLTIPKDFAGEYRTKGCFTYEGGKWHGKAYWSRNPDKYEPSNEVKAQMMKTPKNRNEVRIVKTLCKKFPLTKSQCKKLCKSKGMRYISAQDYFR